MLAALSIRDIVLIDRLNIEFGHGLSVLTGETGAGKSILLDALSLAIGARGDAGLVRAGASDGEVIAVFQPVTGHPACALLQDNGIDCDDGVILRRLQAADGRTRGFVNDRPVSAQLMREVGALLVEIHGQHDDRALVDAAAHRGLLDAFGGLGEQVAAVRAAWAERQERQRALENLQQRIAAARRDQEYLAHAVEELELLDPQGDEEHVLAERRQLMMQAEKVAGDLKDALDVFDGNGSFIARLSAVLRKLERRLEQAPDILADPVAALDKALSEADATREALERAIAESAFDPRELEQAEERLFALRAAARKHAVQVFELPGVHERMRAELDAIDAGEHELANLAKARDEAAAAYTRLAEKLSQGRRAAAAALEGAVLRELAPLKLEGAEFIVRIDSDAEAAGAGAGPHGHDRVEFWVRTNPGSSPGPLKKIASGGELSRFILALKVALADKGSAPTLIFDEVDTAVGGAVADAIGQRLARLAATVQVLSVTHAPQVAARAARHLRISKSVVAQPKDGAAEAGAALPVTRVDPLDSPSRREEIARMLAGATVTDEARAAAEKLIAGAA